MRQFNPRFAALVACLAFALLGQQSAKADDAKRAAAKVAFEAGQQAYAAGELEAARKHMTTAYELTKAPALAYNIARMCERMSDPDPAIRFYEIYLKRGTPNDKERDAIKLSIAALKNLKSRLSAQVFTAPPTSKELGAEAKRFYLSGVAMFKRGEYEGAIRAFSAAQRFSRSCELAYNLAVTFERVERPAYARDQYRDYLKLCPKARDKAHIQRKIKALRRR